MIDFNIRNLRQKKFTPSIDSFSLLNGDAPWLMYKNANLSIHVTDKCNADCAFCIAHLRYLNNGLKYLKPEIDDDLRYFSRLEQILNITKNINPSVSITGGEPTINRKLPTILKILSSYNVRKRTITTNGTGLFYLTNKSNKTILDCLSDYNLEHLNISRAHYDDKKNSEIMVMNEKLIPNSLLSEMIQEAKRKNINIRLSCALLKNGICSKDDIYKYIDWGTSIGADNIIFRQLMQFDEDKVTPGRIPDYCLNESIDLMPIWNFFDNDTNFKFYHQVLGYYYYVEVRKYNKINVVSESADLRLINPQLEKFKKMFNSPTGFEMVFHPNGNLCAGWHEHEQIISEFNENI